MNYSTLLQQEFVKLSMKNKKKSLRDAIGILETFEDVQHPKSALQQAANIVKHNKVKPVDIVKAIEDYDKDRDIAKGYITKAIEDLKAICEERGI